jgi:hypothetical protein
MILTTSLQPPATFAGNVCDTFGMANFRIADELGLGRPDYDGSGDQGELGYERSGIVTAADAGSAVGLDNLGTMYDQGQGVPKDDAQAASWYRKAADAGNADGMNNLGVM